MVSQAIEAAVARTDLSNDERLWLKIRGTRCVISLRRLLVPRVLVFIEIDDLGIDFVQLGRFVFREWQPTKVIDQLWVEPSLAQFVQRFFACRMEHVSR
jgi:hypothetical protein